jgi:hypothetical protein
MGEFAIARSTSCSIANKLAPLLEPTDSAENVCTNEMTDHKNRRLGVNLLEGMFTQSVELGS